MHRSKRLLSLHLTALSVLFASVFSFGGVAHAQTVENPRPLSVNQQIIQERSEQVEQKATILQSTSQEVQTLEQKKQELADKLAAEKKAIEELKQKLAQKKAAEERAKAEATQRATQPTPARTASAPAPRAPAPSGGGGLRSGCGDNQYAAYIYGQESGGRVTGMCNTAARNAGGCFGIGQACPGSKVAHCGTDYGCQNAWFTNYAMQRYGSWAAAYNFHRANGWW